ncbi:MAG: MBL fold metallo-hydrolase [Solobacterium sp.]|nr:MBL fold metallo-hydrolase [Solobacterium sp.]
MRRLKIGSVFKTFEHHIFLLACLFYLFLWMMRFNYWYALILCAIYWFIRFHDSSIILVILLFLIPAIKIPIEGTSYRVQDVHQNYIVFKKGSARFLYYTNEMFYYDDIYLIEGDFQPITSSKGFFSFDFGAYCREEKIDYEILPRRITFIKEGKSLRHYVQRYLYHHLTEKDREIYLRLLFGIKSDAFADDSFFNVSGFRITGFLVILERIFSRIKRQKRDCILLIIHCFIALFYHFPLLITQSLIYRIVKMSQLSSINRLGWSILLSLLLFPESINRISFIYPFGLRICTLFYHDKPIVRYLFLMITQSIFFHYINPIELLLFQPFYQLSGLLIFLAWSTLLTPFSFHIFFDMMDKIYNFIHFFRIPGSIIGFGLIIYLFLVLLFPKEKRLKGALCLLLGFQFFGLFHPLGEVSFINVGQGDSILLRAPFNTCNILIDTGKPNKEKVLDTYLSSLGIKKIHTLIVTHQDDDHSGNKDFVVKKYQVENVIEEHRESQILHGFQLYDLNPIQNEDENESSIVNYFQFHGMRYLLMADANENTEREIIKQYPNLEVDVLKIGHHGSKTSSSDYFLQHVHPRLGIFSCGNYGIYHHPNPEVVKRYKQYRIDTLSTYEEGDIRVLSLFYYNLLITSTFRIAVI